MTTTQSSIETAPRDLEALKKMGRYNLRVLAEGLGVFATEEAKQSFMSGNNEAQAATVHALITELDRKKNGAGAAASSEAVVRQPSNKGSKKKEPANAVAATTTAATTGASAPAGEGAAKLLAAINELNANYRAMSEKIESLESTVTQLQGISSGTNRFVTVAIGLSLKLVEEVLQAPGEQVLATVLDDLPMVENALLSLRQQTEEEGDDEDEEDEEGNE